MPVTNQRGMVLLMVLAVIALLSALLSEFAFSTLVDLRLAETFRDSTRAEYLARGGIAAGRMLLQTDRNGFDARVPSELWSNGIQNYPVAEGDISISIDDLDGKLLLNKLVDLQGNPSPLYRERFIRLCYELALDNPEALADALVDWIDPDHDPNPAGAEDSDYLRLQPAYEASDGPLQDVDELRLVRGFTAKIVNQLRPHVSVFGSGQLNINTASAEVLRCWDADSSQEIENLISSRTGNPFQKLEELQDSIGLEAFTALNRNLDLTVTSTYYLISSQGRVNNGSRRLTAVVDKSKDTLLWQKVN